MNKIKKNDNYFLSSFDKDWNPRHYLRDYYKEIEPDEIETIHFFVDVMRKVEKNTLILFFGVGPALHHVFLTAPKAKELHLADYLKVNLNEIDSWINFDSHAHDWKPFIRYTLECEGIEPTNHDIAKREKLTRNKILILGEKADAGEKNPLGSKRREQYPIVFSPYCADSSTSDKATWEKYMRNIASLVSPGGKFVTAALRKCRSYAVGGKSFPCANIDEDDMRRTLELDFQPESITIEIRKLSGHELQGYSGIILAHATKAT